MKVATTNIADIHLGNNVVNRYNRDTVYAYTEQVGYITPPIATNGIDIQRIEITHTIMQGDFGSGTMLKQDVHDATLSNEGGYIHYHYSSPVGWADVHASNTYLHFDLTIYYQLQDGTLGSTTTGADVNISFDWAELPNAPYPNSPSPTYNGKVSARQGDNTSFGLGFVQGANSYEIEIATESGTVVYNATQSSNSFMYQMYNAIGYGTSNFKYRGRAKNPSYVSPWSNYVSFQTYSFPTVNVSGYVDSYPTKPIHVVYGNYSIQSNGISISNVKIKIYKDGESADWVDKGTALSGESSKVYSDAAPPITYNIELLVYYIDSWGQTTYSTYYSYTQYTGESGRN